MDQNSLTSAVLAQEQNPVEIFSAKYQSYPLFAKLWQFYQIIDPRKCNEDFYANDWDSLKQFKDHPLHAAVTFNDLYLLNDLIKYAQLSPHQKPGSGLNLFHITAQSRAYDPEMIDRLMELSVDINGRDQYGRTPSMIAASKNGRFTLDHFQRLGADFKIKTLSELTVMHFAILGFQTDEDKVEILKICKKSNVCWNVVDGDNLSLIQYAIKEQSELTLDFLLQVEGLFEDLKSEHSTYLQLVCHLPEEEVALKLMNRLIQEKINVSLLNESGWSCLHQCINRAMPDLLNLMIHEGVDINRQNQKGQTPLHQAMQTLIDYDTESPRLQKCMVLLLKAGADIHIANSQNQTLLDLFESHSKKRYLEFFDAWLQIKALEEAVPSQEKRDSSRRL